MSVSTTTSAKRLFPRVLIWAVLAIGALFVGLTFFWFVNPSVKSVDMAGPADAVVVFQGSGGRVRTAVDLMQRGVARNLVIPNGRSGENRTELCQGAPFRVFCPDTQTIDTEGEARAIGQLAEEEGWSSLIAVTSSYHVHRATYQLSLCYPGQITAVAADQRFDEGDLADAIAHEWAGTIAAMTFQRAC